MSFPSKVKFLDETLTVTLADTKIVMTMNPCNWELQMSVKRKKCRDEQKSKQTTVEMNVLTIPIYI